MISAGREIKKTVLAPFNTRNLFGFYTIRWFSSAFLFIGLLIPFSAEAGIVSFVTGLFERGHSSLSSVSLSLPTLPKSNIALLQAVLSPEPATVAEGGGEITIVGGTALLADAGPLGTVVDIGDVSPQNDRISVYVVRKGDSISGIAKMFGVSANTIMWANNIRSDGLIREGQTLVILPINGIRHEIKKGETINSIVKSYGGNLEEILLFNNIDDPRKLSIGDEIIIPGGELNSPISSQVGSVAAKKVAGLPEYSGYYIRPINGGRKTQGLHGNNGVDLAPACRCSGQEPILAAASGKVIISRSYGWNGGYGNYMVIAHPNGTQTLYSHTYQNIVESGWDVVQGQVIGYVGSTGRSTGPHLHFEIRGAKNPF